MANNQLTEDLRIEALFRAGEPQDTTSVFWTKALDYLNAIQDTLISGGGVAVGRDLAQSAGIYARLVSPPQTDWWWARTTGVVTTKALFDATALTLTQGSTALTALSPTPTENLTGWRLIMESNGNETAPIIAFHDMAQGIITLDSEWPEATVTGGGGRFVKFEYDLPSDFVRFAQKPFLHSGNARSIDVAGLEQRDDEFPVTQNFKGEPTRAYMVGEQRIAVNGFDDRGFRLEFEYIRRPTPLQGDDEPILPPTHRRVLSAGAAMMIAFDKNDEKMENLASEYRELVQIMHQHQRRAISSGSGVFGQYKTRNPSRRIRSPQANGELFLT